MKNFIAKILIRFITRYNLYTKIGDGEDIFIEVINKPVLFPKDGENHTFYMQFDFKRAKGLVSSNNKNVKIKGKDIKKRYMKGTIDSIMIGNNKLEI